MKNEKLHLKKLLKRIIDNVRRSFEEKGHDPRLIIIDKPHFEKSYTGWYMRIAKFKGFPGFIEVWLDRFPNVKWPILAICYSHGDINRVNLVAVNVTSNRKKESLNLDMSNLEPKRGILKTPLPKNLFGRFIVESYGRNQNFVTVFLYDHVNSRQIHMLAKKVENSSKLLIRSLASAIEGHEDATIDYSALENKKEFVQHLRRERSSKLAQQAKLNDSYICQICDFYFAEKYGQLGRRFAEAHHIVPLAKLKANVKTTTKDLITVCANCHRMLHKMRGEKEDIKKLKAIVRKAQKLNPKHLN